MAQVITVAGEQLFALKAQNNQQLDIDTFIFAYVPGQDPNAPISRAEGLPPVGQRVHQQIIQQVGRVNDNVVIYSTVLDSLTGPFEFNWVGLYSSVNQTLVAISHIAPVQKTVTVPGEAGNTLNRNFGIEYSGIADLTGITVSPETWQLDYTARLNGMEELTRQLGADMNGKDWFIEDGFKVVPRPTLNSFKVTAGAGYVSGLRVQLAADHVLTLEIYPKFVYVDAWFDGTSESQWKGQTAFTVSDTELTDYLDSNGKQHYLCKIAEITAAEKVEDLRVKGVIEDINDRLGAKSMGTINVSEIISNDPEFILPITPELGQFVTLEGHGAANFTITGFGDACPVGYEFSLYIPRTIGNSGQAVNQLGNFVQFIHTVDGAGLDLNINKRMVLSSAIYAYQSYQDATDSKGSSAALHEKLRFLHSGGGRWICVELPNSGFGASEDGDWERSANGLAVSVTRVAGITAIADTEYRFNYPAVYDYIPVISLTAFQSIGISNYPVVVNLNDGGVTGENSYVVKFSSSGVIGFNMQSIGRWKPLV